jgi:hypothetical protein
MKCEDCVAFRLRNDVEGECMLAPPIPMATTEARATPDAWVRPLVYHDDFCLSFAASEPPRRSGGNKPRKGK